MLCLQANTTIVSWHRSRSIPSKSFLVDYSPFFSPLELYRMRSGVIKWIWLSGRKISRRSWYQTHRNSPSWQGELRIWRVSRCELLSEHKAEAPGYLRRNLNPLNQRTTRNLLFQFPLCQLILITVSHQQTKSGSQAPLESKGILSFDKYRPHSVLGNGKLVSVLN
jgi:hypothetical protein